MIIAGNWKMNPNYQAASALFDVLAHHFPEANSRCEIVCFPPSCYFTMAREKLIKTDISWGAQNCHQQEKGAFTGEISAQMVAEFGGSWVLLGHSERREYYSESDALVSDKLAAALAAGLRPVICVGEPEAVRVRGAQDEFVQKQLAASLENIAELTAEAQKAALSRLVIAYEPVWAIGTGQVASLQDIAEMHQGLTAKIASLFGSNLPQAGVPILYGGSVNAENAQEILAIEGVSGALVGGASLKADAFLSICLSAG